MQLQAPHHSTPYHNTVPLSLQCGKKQMLYTRVWCWGRGFCLLCPQISPSSTKCCMSRAGKPHDDELHMGESRGISESLVVCVGSERYPIGYSKQSSECSGVQWH